MDDQTLIARALAARNRAHAPYSGFRVGAALLCDDAGEERLVESANLENASLGLSVCAERNAVARAIYLGLRRWTKLAIATDAERGIPPCGACLQVLREFTPDLEILLVDAHGGCEVRRLAELLPQPFTSFPRAGGGREGA